MAINNPVQDCVQSGDADVGFVIYTSLPRRPLYILGGRNEQKDGCYIIDNLPSQLQAFINTHSGKVLLHQTQGKNMPLSLICHDKFVKHIKTFFLLYNFLVLPATCKNIEGRKIQVLILNT